MSLFDFIFPEQATAMHLGELVDVSKQARRDAAFQASDNLSQDQRVKGLTRRVAKLENDVALLASINALLIKKYIQDTGRSPTALQQELAAVDASDGVVDGGLDTEELRRIVGVATPRVVGQGDRGACPDCGRVMSKNLNRCLYCGCVPG